MNDDDSLLGLIRKVVVRLLPQVLSHGVHRYTVSRDNGDGTLDLAPATRVLHPPKLRVEQWAGPGIEAGLSVGDELAVVFLDPDAEDGAPAIIGHMPLRRGKPGSLKIDATGVITIGSTATAINIGGGSAVALAKAAPVITWAAAVVTALATLGQTVPALAAPGTTKAKGV